MAKRQNQSDHDRMVRALTNRPLAPGETILADIEGFHKPSIIYGHIPDVQIEKWPFNSYGTILKDTIFEVETHDSISDAHTAEQWREFAGWAHAAPNRFFVIVIPQGSALEAMARARNLGIVNVTFQELDLQMLI